MNGRGRKEINKIQVVYHKSVEYHLSNGLHNIPTVRDLSHSLTLDLAFPRCPNFHTKPVHNYQQRENRKNKGPFGLIQ
jgi:hypothetical protein